ncbi:MAG: hypothetical protein A2Z42_03700 [Candidatus Woykebacteria bacterium RBG_19FT_COMBO_43_10]|uniref:Uncharacterized protein n=1 Tax=Candidatus Woykebacteria bacterium RBG_19FT_COMBO_43_10 TaxID=1802598 RepID=A0A1G1WIF9_9BACT|nr:MAG: hypothetical protein A2Z42_03700 [Candidatus Woykebacteria bacterium RBG_19FT_COMBO_43_10]
MSSIVATFERKLECSRAEAIWRMIGLPIFLIAAIAVVGIAAAFFPYKSSYKQQIPALPGDHFQASEILDGEVLVNESQFLELASGNQTFIAPGKYDVSYMVKVGGISYRYDQPTSHNSLRYNVGTQQVQDGVVIRELRRDPIVMVLLFIVIAGIFLLMFLVAATAMTFKERGYGSSRTIKSLFDQR